MSQRIDGDDLEPIVNLVAELEEGSGGHDSKYGSLPSITWEYTDRSSRDNPHLRVTVSIESWTFWNGEQLENFMERVREFAVEHDNADGRIFYIQQDKPLSFSLKIPLNENTDEGENQG
ncbi:hypothetical protein ACM16X_02385 [Haloarcula japonica]|uniref:hypothetical protein n=1 Tax=Haloarcula japonica TaxID=29282 RepID=UPI0039F68685